MYPGELIIMALVVGGFSVALGLIVLIEIGFAAATLWDWLTTRSTENDNAL